MPRFTVKDLFWCMTLIVVSLSGFFVCGMVKGHDGWEVAAIFVLMLASSAALGAGVGALVQRKLIGAMVGLVVMGSFLLGILLLAFLGAFSSLSLG